MCLDQLAQDPEALGLFLATSGLDPDALRRALGSEALARGLVDYAVQNETLLLAICAANALRPESVMRVWAKLNPAG
jgi:hypothetical protein